MESVELKSVWRWECHRCLHLNFTEGESYVPTAEDVVEQPEAFNPEHVGKDGEFFTKPEAVLCSRCEVTFNVKKPEGVEAVEA